MWRLLAFSVLLCLAGCAPSGPASTQTNSTKFDSLDAKVEFLNRYVTFRRTYETLDFDITFFNGGGMSPSPSEWDLRLVATVPAAELEDWVPEDAVKVEAQTDWLISVPTHFDLPVLDEWYAKGGHTIGISRARRIVAVRWIAN